MYFVVQYRTRENSGSARSTHHPAHVEFRKGLGSRVLLAGPLLPAEGEIPVGSLIVVDAKSLVEATELATGDPLCIHGAYDLVSVTPFRPMVFNPPRG